MFATLSNSPIKISICLFSSKRDIFVVILIQCKQYVSTVSSLSSEFKNNEKFFHKQRKSCNKINLSGITIENTDNSVYTTH